MEEPRPRRERVEHLLRWTLQDRTLPGATGAGLSDDRYGGDRPGANLYGNALVAVDAMTGKLKWYFQNVHHDLWDYDLPPQPTLVDRRQRTGRKSPGVDSAPLRPAMVFILDRRTGKPVFGVEERPVPKGDVPGEWYAPTQPFPLKPPQLARATWSPSPYLEVHSRTPGSLLRGLCLRTHRMTAPTRRCA